MALHLFPGQFVLFRGSWGQIAVVGTAYVFLDKWRGQLTTTAPIDEIEEVKGNQRMRQDPNRVWGRRLTDFDS